MKIMIDFRDEYISLHTIILEVNGEYYTVKKTFDTSVICAGLEMSHLVKIPTGDVLNV